MDADRAHELLTRERERIERELSRLDPAADETEDGDEPADHGTELYQHEADEGRADDLHEQLAAVERAEDRLANGTYGLSVESGDPIPDARLEAFPTAERTVEEENRV